jgi:hypothetical protein
LSDFAAQGEDKMIGGQNDVAFQFVPWGFVQIELW